MQSFDDDPEFGGSQDASSDDEQPERIGQDNDADADADADDGDGEGDEDGDADGDEDEEEDGGDDENDDDEQAQNGANGVTPTKKPLSANGERAPTSLGETPVLLPNGQPDPASAEGTSGSPQPPLEETDLVSKRITVREEALSASVYDIVPTIAAPHSTSINVVTSTPDLRWVFSGGSDGYIRRFNWVDTANGKLMLTVAQRHPFVDSVTKAGVLSSYWENEEPQPRDDGSALSPVYSLAVQNQALWLLSGLESGGINLQSVRHEEGKRIHCLKQHTSAVSVLHLAQDERSVLSGSWDKTILDWDLNTGQVRRTFKDNAGQISALEMRPLSSLPVPETAPPLPLSNGTLSSNNESKPAAIDGYADAEQPKGLDSADKPDVNNALSPVDSLFGGAGDEDDDLFGENNDMPPPVGLGDEDDNEFSRAIAQDIQQDAADGVGDTNMLEGSSVADNAPLINGVEATGATQMEDDSAAAGASGANPYVQPQTKVESDEDAMEGIISNGLPHAGEAEGEDTKDHLTMQPANTTTDEPGVSTGAEADSPSSQPSADTTFLAASIDGTIRIWDKRQSTPVAKIVPRNTPPWCMGACWSPDGNYIYAGRRNGTVEEFSLHKGLKGVERTFRFPNGSGSVSAVRAMPNGRHLVCASHDILRLYDLQQPTAKHSSVPFLIVPGHRTGVISQLFLDPSCRFMISTAGNRGWEGNSTQVLLGYEIGCDVAS